MISVDCDILSRWGLYRLFFIVEVKFLKFGSASAGRSSPTLCFRKNFKPVSGTSERFWHSLVVLGGFCLGITVTRLRTLDTYHIHFPKGENAVCIVVL